MALAHWRMKDVESATALLRNLDVGSLSPGQKAILAAMARGSDAKNAADAAKSVVQTIEAEAKMLPEERAFLEKATF